MACSMVEPRLAGESATLNPADFSASILSPAPPLPPAMIAPARPMRRPGGAVTPALKPQTGFLLFHPRQHSPPSSSAVPPPPPLLTTPPVFGSPPHPPTPSLTLLPLTRPPPPPPPPP